MPRPQIVIENPILNTPFAAPARHFRFDDEGITDEIVEGRRPSSYFMPIPKAEKKGGQLAFLAVAPGITIRDRTSHSHRLG